MKNKKWTHVLLVAAVLLSGCITPRFSTTQSGKTALKRAVELRDVTKVQEIIARGYVDVNARCNARALRVQNFGRSSSTDSVLLEGKGNSALSLAILNNSEEIVKVLLLNGADTTIEVVYSDGGVQCRGGVAPINLTSSDFYNVKESRATIQELTRYARNPAIARLVSDPQLAQQAAATEARKKTIEAQNKALAEDTLKKLKSKRAAEDGTAK